MMRRRMIEELCDGIAHLIESCPIEIAKHDPLFRFSLRGFDETHLREIFPDLAVENQPINPLPELRIHWIGEIVLPPKIERQVGIEMRKDNAWQPFYAGAFEQKRHLLGAALF